MLARAARSPFLRMLVFWTPLAAALVAYALDGHRRFFDRWLSSLVISESIALQCWAFAHVVRRLESAVQRRRGRDAAEHGLVWYMTISVAALPLALPLGFLAGGATAQALGLSWGTPGPASYRVGMAFGLGMMVLFFFLRTKSDAREAQRVAELRVKELEMARLEAQLAALTAEMNPHMLFNALNTIASLVHRDPSRAEEVVLQLSDLYRGVLRAAGSTTHPLGQEIALCASYLAIEKARFDDRLVFEVRVDETVDIRRHVPVLILQPFVENAVKHGISSRARGGAVAMHVSNEASDRVAVTIEDDGVGLGRSPHVGSGRAMSNCRTRLALTWGDDARLDVEDLAPNGTRIRISMPTAGAESRAE